MGLSEALVAFQRVSYGSLSLLPQLKQDEAIRPWEEIGGM